ncbi:MAG: glycoside hydrolase family 3 C-terminal domain-containing protein, partial [Paramuribaculum sp.]|nr:glycoside hydrolase family 3 C-terminal domain-containing protein [Paramuribaculum sp.]
VKADKEADMVIFIGGLNKADHQDAEATDRESFALPYDQDRVIEALYEANPRLAVMNLTGNAYSMPWVNKVPAIVQGWYIGSEAGNAIADVLFGDVNPSGKLPMTFAKELKDYAAHAEADSTMYPGVGGDVIYKEGLNVGYRYTDRLKPSRINYAFGHGLSYTDFKLGKPELSVAGDESDVRYTVTVPVTNIGGVDGAEVVQAYVRDVKSSVARPEKELKAFAKVKVAPGQTEEAVLTFDRNAFAYYDPDDAKWTLEAGKFEILIGTSSDNIVAKVPVTVGKSQKWADSER